MWTARFYWIEPILGGHAGVLIHELSQWPAHISKLVVQGFDYVGFYDDSAFGAGGVWLSGGTALYPAVWCIEFPSGITNQVVLDSNPTGALMNLDLEMASMLLHYLALEQLVKTCDMPMQPLDNNTPQLCDNPHGDKSIFPHCILPTPRPGDASASDPSSLTKNVPHRKQAQCARRCCIPENCQFVQCHKPKCFPCLLQ
jgi:hypothetical protein